MYLIDHPDGVAVRYNDSVYTVFRDGEQIAVFAETRPRTICKARKNAERLLARNAKKLGIVTPPP